MNKIKVRLFSALVIFLVLEPPSRAVTITLPGPNTFSPGIPVTPYSAPDAPWSLSFDVDDPPSPLAGTDMGFSVNFTNFSYMLSGARVDVTPQEIRFFAGAVGGLFDVDFIAGAAPDLDPRTGLSLMGPGIFSGSLSAPAFMPGSYTAMGGSFLIDSFPIQSLFGTVVTVTDQSAVPEPGTSLQVVVMGVLGLFAAGMFRRGTSKRAREE